MKAFRLIVRVLATILCGPMLIIGCVWILQGVNLLPGSFMTGHIQWAFYGAIAVVIGTGLVVWLNRGRR
jgi:hypothetical protein